MRADSAATQRDSDAASDAAAADRELAAQAAAEASAQLASLAASQAASAEQQRAEVTQLMDDRGSELRQSKLGAVVDPSYAWVDSAPRLMRALPKKWPTTLDVKREARQQNPVLPRARHVQAASGRYFFDGAF